MRNFLKKAVSSSITTPPVPIQDNAQNMERLKNEIQQLQSQIDKEIQTFPHLPPGTPNELIGKMLLESYLNEKAFNHFVFAQQPIKEAFLSAAFDTCDPEIVCCCFVLVQHTMTSSAFKKIIQPNPRFNSAFQAFHKGNPILKSYSPQASNEVRVAQLKQVIPDVKSSNSLLQYVIEDEINRIEKQDSMAGIENVDMMWFNLQQAAKSKNYNSITPEMTGNKKRLFNFKPSWKEHVDPFQGAILSHSWGCPPNIVKSFVDMVKLKPELDELHRRRLI